MRRNVSRAGLNRKHRNQRYRVRNWTDCLPDVPAFIIGNAPSVNEHNLDLIKDYFSVGLNRIFKKLDTTILLWQDVSLWTTDYHRIHNTQALKVARDIADPRRIYYNFHLKGGPYKFDRTKSHVLYGRGSSGPLAVQLAVSMGCNPIILLGMDCKRGPQGESDFYGDNPHWLPHTLDQCDRGLKFLKEECPVEIISCGNADEYWDSLTLKEVLNRIDPKYAMGRQQYVKQILSRLISLTLPYIALLNLSKSIFNAHLRDLWSRNTLCL